MDNNITLIFWLFDECIGIGSNLDNGNNVKKAFDELYLILTTHKSNITTEYISINYIQQFIYFLQNNSNHIYIINIDDILNKYNNYLIFGGWYKHFISIFYFLNSDNTYTVGIINAGDGYEYQGSDGNKCNGIIYFRNILLENLSNFLKSYKKYYSNKKYYNFKFSTIFYHILFNKLLNKSDVNFEDVSCSKILMYSQVIGSCSFTNIINFMYILSKVDNYEIFLDWYINAKKKMLQTIFTNFIYNIDTFLINVYYHNMYINKHNDNDCNYLKKLDEYINVDNMILISDPHQK